MQNIMFRKLLLFLFMASCTLCAVAQGTTLKLRKWDIPAGNYSGITPLGGDRYAVVTDKPHGANGFFEFQIVLSPEGKISHVENLGYRADSVPGTLRDTEGVVFCQSTGTLFVSAENDQQIIEYLPTGQQTGRKLNIPQAFSAQNIQHNYGFEALGYSPITQLFWTTTENTLKADQKQAPHGRAFLRLQSFTPDLQPYRQYVYLTDAAVKIDAHHKKYYCFGVPEITALEDSSLLVMERELYIPSGYMGAFVSNKIYQVHPTAAHAIDSELTFEEIPQEKFLPKTLITEFRTHIPRLSNYEGMCLGPVLPDGTRTLLLVSDSQDNAGNVLYHLRDRLRVILLK